MRLVDLCAPACLARDAGTSRTEVARLFGVSARSMTRWFENHRSTGRIAPRYRKRVTRYVQFTGAASTDAEWRTSAVDEYFRVSPGDPNAYGL